MQSGHIKDSIDYVIQVKQIMSIHYFEFNSHFNFDSETHNYWEMVYIDRGNAIINAGNNTFTLSQGEVYFHKPGEKHSIASDPKNPPIVFIVAFSCSSKDMSFFKNRRMNVPNPLQKYISEIVSDGQEAYNLADDSPYEELLKKRQDGLFGSEQLVKLNLEILLIKLIRSTVLPKIEADKKTYDKLTNKIIEMLTNNVYGRITVESIAQELGFSRTHISATFKSNCGKTITQYYTDLKISEAKYLIRKELYTVAQISDFLCFDNPHYFYRFFKKETGMTPKEYGSLVSNPDKYAKKIKSEY